MIRTAQGEEAAFRHLVQRWEHEVLAFLIHMLGSLEEAEDLQQDTFVQVWRKARDYRPEGAFRSWLFKIAGNRARSRLRRRRIIGWINFDPARHDLPSTEPGPDELLAGNENAAAVRSAVAELPSRQRQALVLHRFQGLKYREIAVAMGTTVHGVESLIQRAMSGLRRELAGELRGKGEER